MTTAIHAGIDRYLSEQLGPMESELAQLVEVNSYTENADGGRRVADLLKSLFGIEGLRMRTHPSKRYADHLTFTSESANSQDAVALIGHLDTVFPPGSFEGFRRDGDLLRGPGVLDMKGGLVVVAFALKAIAETVGFDAIPSLNVVIVSDEEIGSPEGGSIIRETIQGSTASLTFEAGRVGDAIITRRKGVGTLTVTTHGRAAHAGNAHHEGSNALWALARWVDQVQALTDYDRGITLNVGKISGGLGPNTVPDRGEAIVDLRFLTSSDGERLIAQLREITASVPGTSIELEGGIVRFPLERTDASTALMNEYAASARAYGLGGDEAPLVGGGSDASTSSVMGIASIDGLGPRGVGFHTRDEQIERASLVPKAKALATFLAKRGS